MAITIQDGFLLNTNLPIDDRFIFANQGARDSLNPLRRYEGLQVYVVADQKFYYLKGGIDNTDWEEFGGGAASLTPTVVNTASYTVQNDDNFILVDASATNVTITLPAVATYNKVLYFKRLDASANTVEIIPAEATTIDGQGSKYLEEQWEGTALASDTSQWVIVGGGSGGGSANVEQISIVGDTSLAEDTYNTVFADASSGAIDLTLPAQSSIFVYVKKTDASANPVNIIGTIDGEVNKALSKTGHAVLLAWDINELEYKILAEFFPVTPFTVAEVTANYSATLEDSIILVNATTGNVTITLPSESAYEGILRIKKVDASINTVTIQGVGTIDGEASYVIYDQNISISLVSNGTNWSIV